MKIGIYIYICMCINTCAYTMYSYICSVCLVVEAAKTNTYITGTQLPREVKWNVLSKF